MHVVVLTCSPPGEERYWGDSYYGEGLRRAWQRAGHTADVRHMEHWSDPIRDADLAIMLQSSHPYIPRPGVTTLAWLLCHPSRLSYEELAAYDGLLVSSPTFLQLVQQHVDRPSTLLLQATDRRFFVAPPYDKRLDLVFVGNNHVQGGRRILYDLAAEDAGLAVWGKGWGGVLPPGVLRGEFIEWSQLPKLYASARLVLNDHHPDMRRHGFLNNRTFDVLAAGALVLNDVVPGTAHCLQVPQYGDLRALREQIHYYLRKPEQRDRRVAALQQEVMSRHTLDQRVAEILRFLPQVKQSRRMRSSRPLHGAPAARAKSLPTVGVVIPTYNRAGMLGDTLSALFAQTHLPDEVLLVDDGSSDQTLQVARDFGERLRILPVQHGGKSRALNQAIPELRSEWVWILDDDDLPLPNKLEVQLRFLAQHPGVDVCYTDAYVADRYGRTVDYWPALRVPPDALYARLIQGNFICQSSTLVRAACYRRHPPYDAETGLCEDWDMWLHLARDCTFEALPVPTMIYRVHRDWKSVNLDNAWSARDAVRSQAAIHALLRKHWRLFSTAGATDSGSTPNMQPDSELLRNWGACFLRWEMAVELAEVERMLKEEATGVMAASAGTRHDMELPSHGR